MTIKVTSAMQDAIRNMRKQKGIRGDDLSLDVGKSPSFISRIETGKTKTIDDSMLFSIFKTMMKQSDEAVQEYVDLFIDIVPESNTSDLIDSLSEANQMLLGKFILCLNDNANSFQFLNYVLQAIELSNKTIDDIEKDGIDVFVTSLAMTMKVWKQIKVQEWETYQKLRDKFSDFKESL